MASTNIFIRNFLDKLKIKTQWEAREQYKNAINMFTKTSYDEPHKEQTLNILTGITDQVFFHVYRNVFNAFNF